MALASILASGCVGPDGQEIRVVIAAEQYEELFAGGAARGAMRGASDRAALRAELAELRERLAAAEQAVEEAKRGPSPVEPPPERVAWLEPEGEPELAEAKPQAAPVPTTSVQRTKPTAESPPEAISLRPADPALQPQRAGNISTPPPSAFRGASERRAQRTTRSQLELHFGKRSLTDDEFYRPLDEQSVVGFEYSAFFKRSPVGLSIGFQRSEDSENDIFVSGVGFANITLQFEEIYGGPVVTFGSPFDNVVVPYVGTGLTVIRLESSLDAGVTATINESLVGGYLQLGLQASPVKNLVIGLEARFVLGTSSELNGIEFDADYSQIVGVVGFAF